MEVTIKHLIGAAAILLAATCAHAENAHPTKTGDVMTTAFGCLSASDALEVATDMGRDLGDTIDVVFAKLTTGKCWYLPDFMLHRDNATVGPVVTFGADVDIREITLKDQPDVKSYVPFDKEPSQDL